MTLAHFWFFLAGLFVGCFAGGAVMAALCMAGAYNRDEEELP